MSRPVNRMPLWLLLAALAGATTALFGAYWDDAWHTDRGRDSFFIAPHMLIYGGVALVGGALSVRVLGVIRRQGLVALRNDRTLLLGAVSVAATMASGPIDNAWHESFGRDAVLWSPPHILGIVGTLALGAALLAEARGREPWHLLTSGLVLAAALFPVAEYDTDVPQFATLWYLPVLALGAGVAWALVRLTTPRADAATRAAGVHLAFMGAVSAFLLWRGFDAPGLVLVLPAAVIADLATRARWSPLLRTGAVALVLGAGYAAVRSRLGNGVEFTLVEAIGGTALAWLALAALDPLASGRRPSRALITVAATVALVALLPVASALAHDPGQGRDAGTAAVVVRGDGSTLSMRGRLEPCRAISSGRITARRSGRAITAPLRTEGCAFTGSVNVTARGRWFVYADLQTPKGTIETWLPVHARLGRERVADGNRFAYEPRRRQATVAKYLGGGILYAAMVALLLATFRILRRDERLEADIQAPHRAVAG